VVLLAGMAGAAQGEASYPAKPIRFLINQPPGGPTDQFARMIAARLSERLGQTVVAENKGGAGGVIAADTLMKAPADGYTLLFGSSSLATLVPLIYKHLPYDPAQMMPVGALASYSMYLLINPALPVGSVADLVKLGKAKPGSLSFASGGNGASGHLAGELFKNMAGLDIVHIPYKGNVLAQQDVIAGRVGLMFDFYPTSQAAVQGGRLRVLASTGKTRSPLTPDVPTLNESGLPGYSMTSWFAIFVPPGTPRPIVDKLNGDIAYILAQPAMQAKLTDEAFEPLVLSPEGVTARIKSDMAVLAPIVRQANIHVD
jgi:tripartite-type tricarboxylate transporter receptor subunit TctC